MNLQSNDMNPGTELHVSEHDWGLEVDAHTSETLAHLKDPVCVILSKESAAELVQYVQRWLAAEAAHA